MNKELLQQALDALKTALGQNYDEMIMTGEECRKCESAITSLKAAIAQTEKTAPMSPQLIEVLRGGRQCDNDGSEIIMSRQACCEAADILESITDYIAQYVQPAIKHNFWGAGEIDCPQDIKAANGELHTMRCKVCGDNWRKSRDRCLAAQPAASTKGAAIAT